MHLDDAAVGRRAHRRQRQQAHHLLEAQRIGGDGPDARIDGALDDDAALAGDGAELQLVDGLRHRAPDVDGAHAQLELPGADARQVQEIVEQLRLQARVTLDGLERRPPLLLVTVGSAQYLHPAQDGVQRHAQLAGRLGQQRSASRRRVRRSTPASIARRG